MDELKKKELEIIITMGIQNMVCFTTIKNYSISGKQ